MRQPRGARLRVLKIKGRWKARDFELSAYSQWLERLVDEEMK
ncbi:MAG: hypothetical protein ABSF53_21045 [Terracidiphilus sp.]|jgi:hypothetical protein